MDSIGTTVKANDLITFTPYYITPDGMKVYSYRIWTWTVNNEITKMTRTTSVSEKYGNPEEINEKYTGHLNILN